MSICLIVQSKVAYKKLSDCGWSHHVYIVEKTKPTAKDFNNIDALAEKFDTVVLLPDMDLRGQLFASRVVNRNKAIIALALNADMITDSAGARLENLDDNYLQNVLQGIETMY
ncbi:hypothetical protein ABGV42_00030 [Paenibacillus pabuli]|uniref:hypothetical protein n=1 Tax=Paenibacillus pabuli TaxID=1472 RepID=UPI003242BC49